MSKKGVVLQSFLLVTLLLFALSFVSAVNVDCWSNSGENGGDETSCEALGGGNSCMWTTSATDPFCDDGTGCCMNADCGPLSMTNKSWCEDHSQTYNLGCIYEENETIRSPNGTVIGIGFCRGNFSDGEGPNVDNMCFNFDANKAQCNSNSACSWMENDQNQNPQCGIKNIGDATNRNALASVSDIGCCELAGCSIMNSNDTGCSSYRGNICWYDSFTGFCNPKSPREANETVCNNMKSYLMMPVSWTGSECMDIGGSTFNEADSCFQAGGWYDQNGNCQMPEDGIGGGPLFGGGVNCWFADGNENVCTNITGCTYCDDNVSEILNDTSACYNANPLSCKGHEPIWTNEGAASPVLDISSEPLKCTDINISSACNYGPIPNCEWGNSSTTTGPFCNKSLSSIQKNAPPVQYCEDPQAKNNFTLCTQLKDYYMMPCKWDNESTIVKNCTFNEQAVFGDDGGDKEFEIINSETACTAAGGTWMTENYVDGNSLKQDSWCEVTGFFDIETGQGMANKASCDSSCWACEFQPDGSKWNNYTDAGTACQNSALGYCKWTNDSSAFNGQGWCDFPPQMSSGGADDCNTDCGSCGFTNNPYESCLGSLANDGQGCQWVNDSSDVGGFCVGKDKKTCSDDCFSCYAQDDCQNSSLGCSWNKNGMYCQPAGFSGEICFDAIDNDGDTMVDCNDPDCSFDNSCGGNLVGGDCFAQPNEGACNSTPAFGGYNCIWMNATWNPQGWCDMPGSNCWEFDSNLTACGLTAGCTNTSDFQGGFCDVNKTKVDSASCMNYGASEATCDAESDCSWINDSRCRDDPQYCINFPNSGHCDFTPFATCMDKNESECGDETICIWNFDDSLNEGRCDVACFNKILDNDPSGCGNALVGGICEWRNLSETCQPEVFMMMGGSNGGCKQYDGNITACNENNITCTFKTDSYVGNNVSVGMPSGWCMDKAEYEHFGKDDQDVIDLAFDDDNLPKNSPTAESTLEDQVDLTGMGMQVTDEGFNFGSGVFNITQAIMCNGYLTRSDVDIMKDSTMIGNGNKTTKFYFYLDTDGDPSDGCIAYGQGESDTGYEFMISYISRNSSTGLTETKQLKRCVNNEWTNTNVLITTSKKESCTEIGGFMVAVEKEGLDSFEEFNDTVPMRIYLASANETDTRTSPSDSVGPGYYSPGSINFDFVDCSDPNTKDPKCKNMQKFGFNVFEECKNGIDDDENGLVDCEDPMCAFLPQCAGGTGFNFTADANDHTAPSVMFTDVEKMSDGAFIRVDTNEPSNFSLKFYKNSSTCLSTELNVTIDDNGIDDFQQNANFKPFHSVDLIQDNLNYSLTNGTTYYYKTRICDPSGNCAFSKCLNFTTKTSTDVKSFIFKIDLPDNYTVDIPALNKTDYNFTENFGGTLYDVGIKTNTSVTKKMNFTINCDENLSIGFYGVNILKPTNLDLSNAFICNATGDLIGMNSSLKKWNKLIDDLKLGGATDYIEITVPIAYDVENNITWTDDTRVNNTKVNDYVECSGDTHHTTCKVPVSMGFSAYTVDEPAETTTPPANPVSPGGGGGSSGGGSSSTSVNNTNSTETTNGTGVNGSIGETEIANTDSTPATTDDNSRESTNEQKQGFLSKNIILIVTLTILFVLAIVGVTVFTQLKSKKK